MVRQCEALAEFALTKHIRGIFVQELDHQIARANAFVVEIPDASQSGTR